MTLPHKVFVKVWDSDRIDDMIIWCEQQFTDPDDWDWSYVDDSDFDIDVNFYFINEHDATMFALRWL